MKKKKRGKKERERSEKCEFFFFMLVLGKKKIENEFFYESKLEEKGEGRIREGEEKEEKW